MKTFELSKLQIETFERDGYLIIEDLLSPEEVDLLSKIARADYALQQEAASRADGEGGAVKLSLRNDLSENDIYSAIIRSESLVNAMEQLLGGEVYHYHHKMVLKNAKDGGAWAWHQDYGYWYNFCCLYPLLASCMIAVDKATTENGCLQVLRGSHLMGRIGHGTVGEQTGADPERVEEALKQLELVHCELEPGAGILFHSNLLHRSDQNRSEHPRWAFICCYNAARNNPYRQVRHPQYTPLEKRDDDAILTVGSQQFQAMEQTQ